MIILYPSSEFGSQPDDRHVKVMNTFVYDSGAHIFLVAYFFPKSRPGFPGIFTLQVRRPWRLPA